MITRNKVHVDRYKLCIKQYKKSLLPGLDDVYYKPSIAKIDVYEEVVSFIHSIYEKDPILNSMALRDYGIVCCNNQYFSVAAIFTLKDYPYYEPPMVLYITKDNKYLYSATSTEGVINVERL